MPNHSQSKTKRKRGKAERLIIVLLSDTHAGHKLALLNPETPLMDEHDEPYNPGLTVTQSYLWELYQNHIDDVADLADGCRVILVHNGDITQGTRYVRALSLVSISDQILAATWNLHPWYEDKRINLTHARIIVGTGVHGWSGSAETLIGKALAERYPRTDTRTLYHASIELKAQKGQVIDCAHHGPFPGSRKWLEGNSAAWYLRDAMIKELIDGETPPIVYARAHYHRCQIVGPVRVQRKGKDVQSSLVITPCYTGADDFVRKVTRSIPKLHHGLVALEFEGGLREIHPFFNELDIRTKEVI